MPEAAPLEIRGLGHHFGDEPTLSGVSLTVARGQVVSVLGPSGSGKTTLLRAIAGFTTPSAGSIAIGGVTVFDGGRERVPAERRRVGMVFQDYALFPHLTVADNVAFGIHRDPSRRERVRRLLELTGLEDLGERRPSELSGGQQQRVALARALAPEPALLLLDEPFANLDADRRTRLIAELRRTLESAGASVLLVTHDRAEALAMSDRVAVLGLTVRGGRLLQVGTPEEVYHRPADADAARITGEVWFLEGQGRGVRADTPLGDVALAVEAHGPVRLALRPESLRWEARGEGTSRVVSRQFVGRCFRLWCETPAGEICIECDGDGAPGIGDRGEVTVSAAAFPLRVPAGEDGRGPR